jgi:hypothetical protein
MTAVVLGFAFFEDWHYSTGLFLPFAFALGGLVVASPVIHVIESRSPSRKSRRSLLAATQGAMVMAVLLCGLFPVALVLVFTLTKIPANNFLVTLGALAFAYFLTLEPGPRSRPGAIRRLLISWREPLLSASVIFAVALGLSWMLRDVLATGTYPVLDAALGQIPEGVRKAMQLDDGDGFRVRIEALITLLASVSVFVVFGFAVSSNRVSPHYFYRDRLTEAFLTTEARVKRRPTEDRQGRPTVVLRDDQDLRLEELGDENHRGPYHLIVASLNLSGTQELDRKTMLSDHFIFAKNYVGARQTGYVCTSCYRKGETKLARAMAISGAAASGAAGQHTSFLWSFAMTLFNVRLGYWMENPWNYRVADRKPIDADGWIFWPKYLARELTGAVDASDPLVNLSDGGHTGDNLGLVPLVERRCRLIVVCDCEQDQRFEFGSFNNAVRMVLIEQGVEISIDLHGVVPEKVEGEVPHPGESCVAVGKILYPATSSRPKEEGILVYIKAELMKDSPAHVWNYAVGNPAFPHQTTGDQFFDDAQFEAYRALGETLGARGALAVKEASNG